MRKSGDVSHVHNSAFHYGSFASDLYKDYKYNEIRVRDNISTYSFIYTDELSPQNWEIENDTTTILGYNSQKATCHYRGKDWIAWFTIDVPISEGPWKFYGLPGLITKIYDTKNHYCFELIGFQKTGEEINTEISRTAEPIDRKEFINVKMGEKGSRIAESDLAQVGLSSLKEVIVNAPGIHQKGDTITYVVSGFTDTQDKTLSDVLKKMLKHDGVGTVNIGTGFEPFLWNAELFAMRFTPKAQTLNTYKTNNTGVDIVRETRQFSVDDVLSQFSKNYSLSNYINVRPNYLTDIDAHRARFNKSHLFRTNNLWAIADNIDLTSQVSYTNNCLNSDNFSKTTYFLIDSTIVTDIGQSSLSKQNRLSADITLTNNKPSYYLKNKLNADIYWDDVTMDITGSFPNRQEGSVPERRVSNDLEILSRSGTRTFTINSFNLYQVKPQHLVITRDDETQQQQVHSSAFYTNTNTSLGFYINPVSISMKMGIIGVIRDMESELTGVSDTLGRLSNDISMQYLNLYLSPQAEFKKDGFEARFDMPVSFTPYRYNNKLSDTKETVSKFLVSPRLSMRYFITTRLSASLSGSLSQSPIDEQKFYDGLILTNYRNLSLGYIDYSTATQKSVSAGISYRNAIKTLFTHNNPIEFNILVKYSQ